VDLSRGELSRVARAMLQAVQQDRALADSLGLLPDLAARVLEAPIQNLRERDGRLGGHGCWSGSVSGYRFESVVYGEPSHFGINGGRVSKLWIYDGAVTVYAYDRGLNLDKAPAGLVDRLVAELEAL
jgi:hypothetical protein